MALTDPELDQLLADQVRYYRARAGEYDQWWDRTGPFDWGPAAAKAFAEEADEIEQALAAFKAKGDVLEVASGTGVWSVQLARTAHTLTCVDTAPEMTALNRARFAASGLPHPTYVEADIFQWRPDKAYDAIFMGFWLSHVPSRRFTDFWALMRRALKPGGRVFFVDERPSTMHYDVGTDADQRQRRTLNDGQTYDIVKIYYSAQDLTAALDAEEWSADIRTTRERFYYGTAWTGPPKRIMPD